MPMKSAPHPGEFIRTEIIEAAGLTFALRAGNFGHLSFSEKKERVQWP
jgi:plasmid maintenance system antidote protein VapI